MCIHGADIESSVSRWRVGLRRGAVWVECLRMDDVAEDAVHLDQLTESRASSC